MRKPDEAVYTALKKLNDKGYEEYLVGGAVRDFLLGKINSDYDITTNASPEAVRMVFDEYTCYNVGKKHGTVTVLIDRDKIDITPYRSESDYLDHRHPENVTFTGDLEQDLERRDFTINAMCLDKDGNIVDLHGGMDDLQNRIIRTVGDPEKRFSEDALRILRAIRFKAQLDFSIEEETDRQIHLLKDTLDYISPERKKEELLHLLCFENAYPIINEYLDVFQTFMPFGRIEREKNDFTDPIYSLACLLKDCDELKLRSLKYSNKEIDLIKTLIASAKIDIDDDYQFISAMTNIFRKDVLAFLEQYHHIDLKGRYDTLKQYMVDVNDLRIDGRQIEGFGYEGRQISGVKRHLTDMIWQKKLVNTEEALNDYLQNHRIEE